METIGFLAEAAARVLAIAAGMGLREWLLLFGLLYAGILWFGSRSSGWHKVATHYPGRDKTVEWISMPDFFGREERGGMSLYFGNCESDNSIRLGADIQGLYLSMSIMLRPFHPPIFVPWSDVRSAAHAGFPWSDKKNQILITFALSPDIPLQIDREVAGEIQKRSQGRWTMPELD